MLQYLKFCSPCDMCNKKIIQKLNLIQFLNNIKIISCRLVQRIAHYTLYKVLLQPI